MVDRKQTCEAVRRLAFGEMMPPVPLSLPLSPPPPPQISFKWQGNWELVFVTNTYHFLGEIRCLKGKTAVLINDQHCTASCTVKSEKCAHRTLKPGLIWNPWCQLRGKRKHPWFSLAKYIYKVQVTSHTPTLCCTSPAKTNNCCHEIHLSRTL